VSIILVGFSFIMSNLDVLELKQEFLLEVCAAMIWDWLFDLEMFFIDLWGLEQKERTWREEQARPLDPCRRRRKRSFKVNY
jgi:hypothetical protein